MSNEKMVAEFVTELGNGQVFDNNVTGDIDTFETEKYRVVVRRVTSDILFGLLERYGSPEVFNAMVFIIMNDKAFKVEKKD